MRKVMAERAAALWFVELCRDGSQGNPVQEATRAVADKPKRSRASEEDYRTSPEAARLSEERGAHTPHLSILMRVSHAPGRPEQPVDSRIEQMAHDPGPLQARAPHWLD